MTERPGTREAVPLSKEQLRRMQLLQLDMIAELDRVCRIHGIKYCIAYGTMIGAVRHKGYIPWDDDADIAMLREEYEKFKAVSNELNDSICYFQDHTTDSEYRWGYGKLRRVGTSYVRLGQEHLNCRTGVFVDVFPLDDVPRGRLAQLFHNFQCFLLRKILWAEVGKYSAKGLEKWCYQILSHFPMEAAFAQLEKMFLKSNNSSPNDVRTLTFPRFRKRYQKKEWFVNCSEYEFEGKKFFGPADYDTYLKSLYGDYMTPPPEDEREQNAPVSSFKF